MTIQPKHPITAGMNLSIHISIYTPTGVGTNPDSLIRLTAS